VQARMTLGLTGTPIENNLRELKSLFDIVLPSYMPEEPTFRKIFSNPIEKDGDPKAKALLGRYIRPFMLRRRKVEVLQDLPEKTEELSHCELSTEQVALYQEVLATGRKQIVENLEDGSKPIPYVHIFALLTKLKQICNHPAAYLKDAANYASHQSGKWDLFVELLYQARLSKQKVVVFTQYLDTLDIMEHYLTEKGIGYATIRGQTVNRGEQLKRFKHEPECEIFLGSLNAAGLGIDLTAASVVIHFDRWWNPSRENQATDRVHRIGQQRGVQVFKLITKNTLEENINRLIQRKAKLINEIVSSDDQNVVKHFTRTELLELLQFVQGS
jgi:SNF2 family DNA or RNA helicase